MAEPETLMLLDVEDTVTVPIIGADLSTMKLIVVVPVGDRPSLASAFNTWVPSDSVAALKAVVNVTVFATEVSETVCVPLGVVSESI